MSRPCRLTNQKPPPIPPPPQPQQGSLPNCNRLNVLYVPKIYGSYDPWHYLHMVSSTVRCDGAGILCICVSVCVSFLSYHSHYFFCLWGRMKSDTYRQQAWPLLVSAQQPRSLLSRGSHSTMPDSNRKISNHPPYDAPTMNQTFDHDDRKKVTTSLSSSTIKPTEPPISPCSVIPTTIHFNETDAEHQIQNHTMHNDDATIMWYDVQRYYPSFSTWNTSTTTPPQLVEDFRYLLLHVLEESLSTPSSILPRRYYQGYHIVAGLLLSTFLHTHHPEDTDFATTNHPTNYNEMYLISYATKDTIELLQQMIVTIPFLCDMVVVPSHPHDDSLPRIVQSIRQYIIPLYYYYQHHYHSNASFGTTNNIATGSSNDDTGDNEDMDQYMIGQCMTWILTLFGTGHGHPHHHSTTTKPNSSDYGKRYMDAILASHPYYFIYYLCVSKLLHTTNANVSSDDHCNHENNTEECDIVIRQAIRIMERIPPPALSDVFTWYQTQYYCRSALPLSCHNSELSIYNYCENVDHGGDDQIGSNVTSSTLGSIQEIIQYMFRLYYFHDAMITTVYRDGNHPYIERIHRLVQCMTHVYDYGIHAFQKVQNIQRRTGIVSYSFFVLRRASRKLIHKCRRIMSNTQHRRWLLATVGRFGQWIQRSTVMVFALLFAIMTTKLGWTRSTLTTTDTVFVSPSLSSISTPPKTSFASNHSNTRYRTTNNMKNLMTMHHETTKNKQLTENDCQQIHVDRHIIVEPEQCSTFLLRSPS
jgi:hypothetical protein